MTEATMQGVTLFNKARKRQNDVFELALTYDGIEIRRPNESPRHLSWDRVSEWEIEQRRGGVVLTLRGGGSVTPLVIPHWKVDELDGVLREVTSHAPPVVLPEASPSAAPDSARTERNHAPTFASTPAAPPVDDIVPEGLLVPPDDKSAEPPAPEIAPLVWPGESPLEELPDLSWPRSMSEQGADQATLGEFVLPDEPIAPDAALPTAAISSALVEPAPLAPAPAGEPLPVAEPVIEPLVSEGPVVDVLALVDDVLAEPDVIVPPEVVTPRAPVPPAPVPPVVKTEVAFAPPPIDVETLVAPTPEPPIVIPPTEGSPEAPPMPSRSDRRAERNQRARAKVDQRRVVQPRVERPRVTPKAERSKVERPKVERPKVERPRAARRLSWGLVTTVVLLGALALAVALVLAQSAGIIHLPFFGNPQ